MATKIVQVFCTYFFTLIIFYSNCYGQPTSSGPNVSFERADVSIPPLGRTKGGIGNISLSSLGLAKASPPDLPVQLPSNLKQFVVNDFFSDSDSYSATLKGENIVIQVHGTRILAVTPNSPAEIKSQGFENISLNKSETGYDATFSEFGARYLISVECIKRVDVRCSKGSFIYKLATSFVVYPSK